MSIEIQLSSPHYAPGQMLQGTVRWAMEKMPSTMKLSVYWETSGKGTDDTETYHTEEWEPERANGSHPFSVLLPRGPLTVQGTLIAILWQIECTSKRPNESSVLPFELAHGKNSIRLTSVDTSST